MEEDDIEDEDGIIAEEEVQADDGDEEEDVAHKDVLYRMFGKKEADYFLYPRVEPAQKTKRARVPAAIRKQGGELMGNIMVVFFVLQCKLRNKYQVQQFV